jgi:hypothetical protein
MEARGAAEESAQEEAACQTWEETHKSVRFWNTPQRNPHFAGATAFLAGTIGVT